MTDYYNEQLEEAHKYYDFVTDVLLRELGIVISVYSSQKYQYEKGESAQGIEIKQDKEYAKTGNLWIETDEKTNAANPNYVPSGIYRDDNTWLWVQGNYETIFIFAKNWLVRVCESGQLHKLENHKKTSLGMLLDKTYQQHCIKRIEVGK